MSTDAITIYISSRTAHILGTNRHVVSEKDNQVHQLLSQLIEDKLDSPRQADIVIGADISEQIFIPWVSSIEKNTLKLIPQWCDNFYLSQKRKLTSYQKKIRTQNYKEPIESIFFYDVEKELSQILADKNLCIRNIYLSWLNMTGDKDEHLSVIVEQDTLTSVFWKNSNVVESYQEKITTPISTEDIAWFIRRSFLQMHNNLVISSIHISYYQHNHLLNSEIASTNTSAHEILSLSHKNVPSHYRIYNTSQTKRRTITFMIATSIFALSLLYPYAIKTYFLLVDTQITDSTPSATTQTNTEKEIMTWMSKSNFDLLSLYKKINPRNDLQISIEKLSIHNPGFYHIEGMTSSLENLYSYMNQLQHQFPQLRVQLDRYSLESSRKFAISIGKQNE